MKCSLESIQKGEPVLKKLLPLLLFLVLVLTALALLAKRAQGALRPCRRAGIGR